MAHVLRLVDAGGTVLLDLNDGTNWGLEAYRPLAPGERTTDATTLADGGERPHAAYSNVNEQADFWVTGISGASVMTQLRNVQRLFALARRYQERRIGTQVFVEFGPEGGGALYRSEILGGHAELDEAALDWQWVGVTVQVRLGWTRRFFWEASSEAEVALTNGNGNQVTGGLNIFNCSDGSGSSPNVRHNYVEIATSGVSGDLPSPPRLQFKNTYATQRTAQVFVAHNVRSAPASFAHTLEAEAATGGTNQASGTASGGNYKDTASFSTSALLLTWSLSTAFLDTCLGNYFQVLARLVGSFSATDVWVQLKLLIESTTVLWEGPWVNLKAFFAIQELGALQLPPALAGLTGVYPLQLALYGKKESGSTTLSIDFLQFDPLDGYRRWVPAGFNLGQNATLYDDMRAGQVYTDGWATAGKTPHYAGEGAPILLRPNEVQRLYFLATSSVASTAEIDRSAQVRVYYRPRRLLL